MLPLRSHISLSTAALVLVIPVVAGAVVGGLLAGAASVAAGFLVYDYWFVTPYSTLSVRGTQNWTALFVYVVVMLLVARVVTSLNSSKSEATRSAEAVRRVSELSELLVGDQPVNELLGNIVRAALTVFNVPGVTLLVLDEGHLKVVASAGDALSADELHQLDPQSGIAVGVGTAAGSSSELRTVALTTSGGPVGMLAMRNLPVSDTERAVLNTFANDAALAIERARLREQALRSKLLEEVDRLRHGLMGAISHDLRTPLATIKVASSTLSDTDNVLSKEDTDELHQLIEIEASRLTRLVTNLLDMTRIEAGVFSVYRDRTPIAELVRESISALGAVATEHRIRILLPATLPDVDVDRLIMEQVLINLLDNASRHSPAGGVITVQGELRAGRVELSVADQGPGIVLANRESVFDRFTQFDTAGRAGLGLTIARTFVEAHGERIWYEEVPGGGARFVFSLPPLDQPASR
jgi:two-component system sensor histidine kinase KdpD